MLVKYVLITKNYTTSSKSKTPTAIQYVSEQSIVLMCNN